MIRTKLKKQETDFGSELGIVNRGHVALTLIKGVIDVAPYREIHVSTCLFAEFVFRSDEWMQCPVSGGNFTLHDPDPGWHLS